MRRSLALCAVAIAVGWASAAVADATPGPVTVAAVPIEWLHEHSLESLYATLLSVLGGILAFFVSTYLVLRQLRDAQKQMLDTQRWNVRKTSEETLVAMITGDFPKLMDRLILEFGWDILAHTSYDVIEAGLPADKLIEVDVILRNVLRHLEVTCINMKNGIIDEEICFDYLRSILTTFYTNCKNFIEKERRRRREEKIFREIETYAIKWLALIERESGGVAYSAIRTEFAKAG
jgi:hypothetical protein